MGGGNPAAPAMALVFPAQRPGRAELARLGSAGEAGLNFVVTEAEAEGGAAEIIAMGLTFDVLGLAERDAVPVDLGGPLLGLAAKPRGKAITIVPAPHIRTVPLMLPVLRVLAGVASRIGAAGAAALQWEPAGLWVDPAYFVRTTGAWLEGGAFPAPGLISFERVGDALRSRGLAALTGQELVLAGDRPAEDRAALAVRLVHLLTQAGRLLAARQVRLPDGAQVTLRPSADGRHVEGA